MEKVLKRNCRKFYKVRGMIFAEAFWIAMKSGKAEDREKERADLEAAEKEMASGVVGILLGMRDCKRKLRRKK